MAWFEKRARARKQIDEGREALAASVEEVAARQELWDEKEEELSESSKSSIIPPRLSLQSRSMPAVRIDQARRAPAEQRQHLPENGFSAPARTTATSTPRLGRSTRVHLQAVRSTPTRETGAERSYSTESTRTRERGKPEQRALDARGTDTSLARLEPAVASAYPFPPLSSGSGVIKQGQKDATVANPRVSERSVVVVTLTDNPGPVVVHYVSLYPRRGFTFHLSAPVAAPTSFNYVIWSV